VNIAVIDFIFAGIIVLFILRCVVRGFVSEIMSLAAVVFGLLSAIFLFRTVGEFIRDRFMPEISTVPEIIAFIALFLIVFILARVLEAILQSIIGGFGLDGLDRFLGAVLGFAEGVVVVCLILFVITIQPFFYSENILRNSFFAEILMPFIIGRRWDLPGMIAWTRETLIKSAFPFGEIQGGIYLCLKTL